MKAVAFLNGMRGSVANEQMGLDKNVWKVLDAAAGEKAVVVDLGSKKQLNGMAYIPGPAGSGPGTVNGTVYVSDNGKKWRKVEAFELSNLINDPSRRLIHFARKNKARYVKVLFNESPEKVGVNNIDIF